MNDRKYTAWLAVKATLSVYNTPSALAVFDDVVSRKRIMRMAVCVYNALPFYALKALLLLLYGLYSFLSLRMRRRAGRENSPCIAIVSGFGSEQKAIDRVLGIISQKEAVHIGRSVKNVFSVCSLRSIPLFLACLPRLFKIARKLSMRGPMMPCLLSTGALCSYLRLQDMLAREKENLKAVLTGSNYQPVPLSLMAAAHKNGLKVIYTNHSFSRAAAVYKPPLYADYSILTGRAKLDEFAREGQTPKPCILKGLGFESKPMRLGQLQAGRESLNIGIFLTAKSELEEIRKLFSWCLQHLPVARLSLRPHPVDLVNQDFSVLKETFPGLVIDNKLPVQEDAENCDLVFCGNSNSALEIICIGTPAVYAGDLDRYDYDTCGFVSGDVLPDFYEIKDALSGKLCVFYDRPDFVEKVRYYNDAYLRTEADRKQVDDKIRHDIDALLLTEIS